jgi:hypothetical protein
VKGCVVIVMVLFKNQILFPFREVIITLLVHKNYTHTRHIEVGPSVSPTSMCLVWVQLLCL